MLVRVKTIKNVGRFIDCNSAGNEFAAETIVYGENTNGKSTLTAILRSLSEGNGDYIIGRKTFGETDDQKVSLCIEESGTVQEIVFPSQRWNKGRDDIIIFDNKFISDNVYEGEGVTHEHQTDLHEVLLGLQGGQQKQEVDKLHVRSEELKATKKTAGQDFNRSLGTEQGISLEDFMKLPQVSDANQKVVELERQIKLLENKQAIVSLLDKYILALKEVELSTVKSALESTISVDQSQIEAHIAATWNKTEHTKHFLKEGTSLTKEEKQDCVFCGQTLGPEALELLEVYEAFFAQGYEELQTNVSNAKKRMQNLNVEALLRQLQTDLAEHDLDSGLTEESILQAANLKSSIGSEVSSKSHNLQYAANLTPVNELINQLNTIKSTLESLKETVNTEENDGQTLKVHKQSLKELKLGVLRHSEAWSEFCSKVEAMDAEAKTVRSNRDAKRETLNEYAEKIYATHKDSINAYLKAMGADFRVKMTPITKLVGKTERVFSLVFFENYDVDIAEENPANPNFSNTLSDSDKRVLAFAFFLSLLSHDEDLDKKIVVFDDPISSLDDERKRKSIYLLADIACCCTDASGNEVVKKPKQRIIITHEREFYKVLSNTYPFEKGNKLKIARNGLLRNKKNSKIDRCDVEEEFPDDYVAINLKVLKKAKDSNTEIDDFPALAQKCRKVLENIFKRKYHFELEEALKAKKGVRTFVTTLAEEGIAGYDVQQKKDKFLHLCNDLNIEMHDNNTERSYGDGHSILDDFFECLLEV